MKIKNKLRFVKILTENLGEYTDIALLVDKEGFLNMIEELRIKYNLDYDYANPDPEKIYFEYELKTLDRNLKLKEEFNSDVEKLRIIYSLPPHFTKVIKSSIIYGIVGESDYSRAYLEEQEISQIKNPYEIPDIKYSIVIHSGTELKDIEEVFKQFREKKRINFKGTQQEKDNYQFGYGIDLSLLKMNSTRNAINHVRKWHIRRQNGETPLEIALDVRGLTKKDYKELVEKFKNIIRYSPAAGKIMHSRIDGVYKLRDTIKTQTNRYRSLIRRAYL